MDVLLLVGVDEDDRLQDGARELVERRPVELLRDVLDTEVVCLDDLLEAVLFGERDPRLHERGRVDLAPLKLLVALLGRPHVERPDLVFAQEAVKHGDRRVVRALVELHADRPLRELDRRVHGGFRAHVDALRMGLDPGT